MRKEIVNFAKTINRYKNELARIYNSAKQDFNKVSKLSKDRLKAAESMGQGTGSGGASPP